MTPEPAVIGLRTLADRLSEGKLPPLEALRYATMLGETLRQLHACGKVHGAVAPDYVVLARSEIGLAPARNPQDQAADVQADISGFAAVLYEMLTASKAPAAGADALESTGIPGADKLIAACLAKNASARPLSMHKVLLELKLILVAARRAHSAAVRQEAANAAVRAEIRDSEARLAARLEAYEESFAQQRQNTAETLQSLSAELAALKEEVAAARQEASANDFAALERGIQSVEGKLAAEIETREKAIAAHIESMRVYMLQNDDLVGKVVEAMEVIQDSVLSPENPDL